MRRPGSFLGVATYEKEVVVPDRMVTDGFTLQLQFGDGQPIPAERLPNGMRAWLEAPVRDAAIVFVNGERVGSVWAPPFAIALSGLRRGANMLRIEVANLAINHMAGHALPDYRLLNLRYGVRFEPQDMDKVRAEPAGLLGEIHLVATGAQTRW